MTNQLTDDHRETLARAKAREGTAPSKPWRVSSYSVHDYFGGKSRIVIEVHNVTQNDTTLIADAPNLDALAIAQADIIAQQAARIALLENELRLQTGGLDIWTVE